jgi:iron complex transport system substrate-binding protein
MLNVEELVRARPDVVIQWDFNLDTVVAPMENAGLKVLTVGSEDRAARRAYIAGLGRVLGKEERAQSLLDWDDQTIAALAEELQDVPPDRRPRIVFIDGMNGNELTVFGTQQVYFEAGGLLNAAAEAGFTRGSVNVGAETVLSWNPDLVLVNYSNTSLEPEDIFAHPVLAALPAVQQGRVYKTPAIDPATAAGGEMVYQWLAKVGYPDRFDLVMRATVADGFQRLYGATLTAAQIDSLLQMDENRGSAGYAAFAAAQ